MYKELGTLWRDSGLKLMVPKFLLYIYLNIHISLTSGRYRSGVGIIFSIIIFNYCVAAYRQHFMMLIILIHTYNVCWVFQKHLTYNDKNSSLFTVIYE